MKITALLVCLTYVTATLAVAIAPQVQAPLGPAEVEVVSAEPKLMAGGAAVEEGQATAPVAKRADGPETQVPVQDDLNQEDNDDGEEDSCFCAGTSICCRKDGEVDCGYGLCGVWI